MVTLRGRSDGVDDRQLRRNVAALSGKGGTMIKVIGGVR
jgi:hypothetical protein